MNKLPDTFKMSLNLAGEKLGARVLYATDDFFAEKENLILEKEAVFIPDKYTDRGKWMDGWESRRRRTTGHDWCVIKLGAPGKISGFDIDTSHFLGNHPPFASIEAALHPEELVLGSHGDNKWKEVLTRCPLLPGSHNYYECSDEGIFTHVRLHIYPDGGVARFRVYGEVVFDWSQVDGKSEIDLGSASLGARAIRCNDMFFSSMNNLIMPRRGRNMGDGWETKRSRVPGNVDWVIIKLAHTGQIRKILVDTAHFKGNYPDSCSVEVCCSLADDQILQEVVEWIEILPEQKLFADHEHEFMREIIGYPHASHVRLKIYPDGGVSRLRLIGNISSGCTDID